MATAEVSVVECPPETVVEGGVPVAALALGPEDLGSRAPLTWHSDEDELDAVRFTVARAADAVAPFVLLAYEHDPIKSITVVGNPESVESGQLDKLLLAMHISEEEILDRIDKASVQPAASLELIRSAEQTQIQIRQQLDTIRKLSAQLQHDVAKQVAAIQRSRETVPKWLPDLLQQETFTELTERQQQVLLLLVEGSSVDDVAMRLGVSRAAVMNTLGRVRRRLTASSSTGAERRARERRRRRATS